MSARYHHGEVSTYHLSASDGFEYGADRVLADYDGERVVYLTTPHNPTGSEITPAGIELVAEETDDETLVVVDEAYGEFTDVASAVSLLGERDDVAVIRTFSKVYGLAGLRLGYALVPDAWADAYARVNTPFSAGELACRAGLAALDDAINAPTYDSGGNFVLVDVGAALGPDAPGLADSAVAEAGEPTTPASAVADTMQRKGVIIRNCSSFGLPNCVRITCGTEHETRRAVEALNTVLADRGEDE